MRLFIPREPFHTPVMLITEEKIPRELGEGLKGKRRCERAICSKNAGSLKLLRPAGNQRESTVDALLQICAVLVFRLIDHPAQCSTCCLRAHHCIVKRLCLAYVLGHTSSMCL